MLPEFCLWGSQDNVIDQMYSFNFNHINVFKKKSDMIGEQTVWGNIRTSHMQTQTPVCA